MEAWLKRLSAAYRRDRGVAGICVFRLDPAFPLLTDGFDASILVVMNGPAPGYAFSHYIKEDGRIQEYRLSLDELEHIVLHGKSRNVIHWILQGEIVLDQDTYLEGFRERLSVFPEEIKEQRLLREFSAFLASFMRSKEYLAGDHILDAYSDILESLHHYARIVILEEGHYPEATLWRQLRKINPGVYKLYEELTQSGETLRQRVELVQLACEFSVMSKLENCCSLILKLLNSRPEAWSVAEIASALKGELVHLSLLLDKLVRKSLISEVAVALDQDAERIELRYLPV